MLEKILFALWFFWPAGVATMVPVLVAYLPVARSWNRPLDGGVSLGGRRLLGENKTWRGFIAGGLAGGLWFLVQIAIFNHSSYVRAFCPQDFANHQTIWLGLLLGFGSVTGDAVGSFFKRRLDIQSGQSWFPYDQLDFIIGGLIFSAVVIRLSLIEYFTIVVVWLGVHLLFGCLGYVTRLKPTLL